MSNSYCSQFPEPYGLLLDDWVPHSDKRGPVPTFLRGVTAIKLKNVLFLKIVCFLTSNIWCAFCVLR